MTNPQTASAAANLDRNLARAYLGTVKTVDTVTSTCSVDPGDGANLTELLYLGPAPTVGDQVVVLTFRTTSVVLGGRG